MGATRLQELKRAVESSPDNLDKWYELGKYAADRFIVGISEKALAMIIRNRPDDPNILGLLAKALNRRRNLKEAEKIYKRAVELSPDNLELLTGLAVVYVNGADLAKGEELFRKVLYLDPGFPWAVHGYLHNLEMNGRIDEIEPLLRTAIKSNPDSPLLNVNYSNYLKKMGDTRGEYNDFLQKALETIVDADPEEQSRTLRVLLGMSRSDAFKYSGLLLEKDPDHLDILMTHAQALSATEPEKGRKMLEDALAGDPENVRLMMVLMGVYLRAGNLAAAMKLKERVDKSQPEGGITALVDLVMSDSDTGGLLTSRSKRERYLKATGELIERFPAMLSIHMQHIVALCIIGRVEDARAHALRVIKEVPQKDFVQVLRFGLLLRTMEMFSDAGQVLEAAEHLATTKKDKLLVKLVGDIDHERYSCIVETIEEYLEGQEGEPRLYGILGRAQKYVSHPDAAGTIETAAELGQYDSKILLASILKRDEDDIRAKNLLGSVLQSPDATQLEKARALIGLDNREEAVSVLESHLEENPADLLGWDLLFMLKRNEGEGAVRAVVRRRLQAISITGQNSHEETIQSLVAGEIVEAEVDKVFSGILAGEIKKQLLRTQIESLLVDAREDGETCV